MSYVSNDEEKAYYLCFGGANISGAFASDLEPNIHYGTQEEASDIAVNMCAEAMESYGEIDEDCGVEIEYEDSYTSPINSKDLHNWDLWSKLKAEVKRNGHKWANIVKQYNLEE
jgi:hypothetical protein